MTRSEIIIWIVIATIVGLSFFVLGAIAASNKAHATDWDWSIGNGSGYHHQKPRRKVRRHRPRQQELRYYAPPLDDDRMVWGRDDDKRPICVPSFVEVKSTEHTTADNAMEAAKKMWAAAAQWDWGSKYMELKLAKDYRQHCGQSNAMDTASGRINEAVSQLSGKEGVNVRCVIRARPCRAILESVEGHR
jgi:hypothetical protein